MEPMYRRTLAIAITAVFVGMALAGCASNNGGNTTTTPTGTTSSGGSTTTSPTSSSPTTHAPNTNVFTTISAGEAESLDPAYDYESAGGQILQNVYETLYYYAKNTESVDVKPKLAADMPTYNADKSEMTIKLRDATFHDGNKVTADDVKWSLDRLVIMNDPDGPAAIYASLAGAEKYFNSDMTQADRDAYLAAGAVTVVDNMTVKIKLDYPDPAILSKLAFTPGSIVEKKWGCEHKASDDTADCFPAVGKTREAYLDDHEMGTGAFTLDSWQKGQQIVLKRYDNYWGEKAKVQQVIVKKVDDFNTRLLALKSGDGDDVYIPVDHEDDLKGVTGIRIIERDSFTVGFIGFNQHFCGDKAKNLTKFTACMASNGDAAPKDANGVPAPDFFADKNMRQAFIYAFDYDTYYKDILKQHGSMLNGAIPKGLPGYDASIPGFKRDIAKAKEFYAKTNYSNGFSMTIYYNSGNTVREKTAALLAQNLRDLGANIKVDSQALDWSTAFLPKQRAQALPIFYLGWAPDYAFPDDYTTPFGHSTLGVYAKRVQYSNPELDKLLDSLMRETDQGKITSGYSQAVKMMNEDAPYLWLAQASNYHVERDWVQGYYYNPMFSGSPNVGDYSTVYKV